MGVVVTVNSGNTFANLDILLDANVDKALEKACLYVEAEAKKNCPVADGILRESITHSVDNTTHTGVIGTNIEYAPYVHQGTGIYAVEGNGRKEVPWVYKDAKTGEFVSTKGIKPTPFLADAINHNTNTILSIMAEAIGGNEE